VQLLLASPVQAVVAVVALIKVMEEAVALVVAVTAEMMVLQEMLVALILAADLVVTAVV
jgi:hypothetical protein